ncbi:2-phospho-L-lactate guanylyltransferase [Prauserella endophytica]|nr:2-phospho-L-lactate guanylyltransferase [Prauserella endophytica]
MTAPPLWLLMPVKPPHRAKSRLRGLTGLRGSHEELVLAMAADTLAAALDAPGVAGVVAVTGDPVAARTLAALGARTFCTERHGSGLNAALDAAAARLRDRDAEVSLGVLPADLPALRSAELGAAIAHAGGRRGFCTDIAGTGTTLLLAGRGPLEPSYGPDSARRHARSATELRGPWPSVRADVDTPASWLLAAGLGLGPRSAALARPGLVST